MDLGAARARAFSQKASARDEPGGGASDVERNRGRALRTAPTGDAAPRGRAKRAQAARRGGWSGGGAAPRAGEPDAAKQAAGMPAHLDMRRGRGTLAPERPAAYDRQGRRHKTSAGEPDAAKQAAGMPARRRLVAKARRPFVWRSGGAGAPSNAGIQPAAGWPRAGAFAQRSEASTQKRAARSAVLVVRASAGELRGHGFGSFSKQGALFG